MGGRPLATRLARMAGLIASVIAVATVAAWVAARPASPDMFYQAAIAPQGPPGSLVRSETFARGTTLDRRAWRILYATTRSDDKPAIASAVIMASASTPPGPRPVIAWAHGTTGIAPGCAPSVMADPFANVPAVDALLREGWIYVATDYAGLGTGGGHAYLVGDDAARAVLDSVRAARRMEGLTFDNRVVVWGHSQGGNSALWTGQRAAQYAPDVNVLGLAALAPASDLQALVTSARSSMFGKIVSSYLIHAYSRVYPEIRIENYVSSSARFLARDIATRCAGGWETLVSVAQSMLLPAAGVFAGDPAMGPLGARLQQNTPSAPIAAPVLIAQGATDDLVLPDIQQRYVAARCTAGQRIDYREYPSLDHISLVGPTSPLGTDLITWSRDRLAGLPATGNCPGR